MANIGEVTARLRADVGPYVTGMQQAGVANRDFAITGSQTASRTQQLEVAFQRLERREPTMALRQVRGAIGLLAAEALGATGPLGRMAESLLFLTGGTTLTLGVLAGLAAIGLAIKHLEDVSIDTSVKIKELRQHLQQLGDATPEAKFRNQQASIVEINRQIADQSGKLRDAEGRWRGLVTLLGETNSRTIAAAHSVAALKDKLAELRGVLFNIHEAGIGRMAPITVKPETDFINRALDSRVRREVMLTNEAERQRRLREEWLTALRVHVPQPMETSEEFVARVRHELGDLTDKADETLSRDMERAGYHAMRSLINGLLRGKTDFQDLFLTILEEFLSVGLGQLFGGIFKAAGLGGGGGGAAQQIGNLGNLVMNVPAASNPIVAARDAQWQEAWRETARVAHASGFRLG